MEAIIDYIQANWIPWLFAVLGVILGDIIRRLKNQKKDPEPPITEEYPAWEPYNGIPPVPYQVGSKVTHNGKKWESMVPNNVWEPGAFGVDQNIWKEVV